MHDVAGIVDIQSDGGGWTGVAGAVQVDHGVGHAHHLAQGGCVLPARNSRLRAEIITAVRQAPAGKLEPWVSAQMIEVVSVFVAASDGKDAGAQDVVDAVRHEQRIARIGDQSREPIRDPQLPLHRAEQHDAAIGCDASTIEGGGQLLATDGWKMERQGRINRHGGCGSARSRGQDGFDTQSLSAINALRDTRQRIPGMR